MTTVFESDFYAPRESDYGFLTNKSFLCLICYVLSVKEFYSLADKQFSLNESILREERDALGCASGISDGYVLEDMLYTRAR